VRFLDGLFRSIDWRSSGKWTALSILVGGIAGGGAIAFQILGQTITHLSLELTAGWDPKDAAGEHSLYDFQPATLLPWMIVAVMTVGGLLSGWLVYTFAPEAEGHGTDAAIEAYHNRRGAIRARIPLIKTLASAITIGTGGSGGREGPIAQIGGAFGSCLGKALKLPARDRRILLAAGMGAGVGAIFRAPLAGALFAAEILYSESDLESEVIIPAATSSIIAYSVYTLSLPESVRFLPLFGADLGNYAFATPLELIPYAILAVILVGVEIVYIKVFYGTHVLFARLPVPKALRPAIGAGLAGTLAVSLFMLFGEEEHVLAVLSTGYYTLQAALSPGSGAQSAAGLTLGLLLTIAVVKIFTTSLTISSGGSGGVFGPSMVIGGCVGTAVGMFFHEHWPDVAPEPQTFGIVGMAGFFAGCAHAPFSTIIMVSEMTGGYHLLLPTMWVSTLCFAMGRRWKLYSKQVPSRLESPAHRGDFLVDVLEGMRVGDVFDPTHAVKRVHEAAPLEEIVHILAETQQHYFPVVDDDGRMVGIFSGDDVRAYLYDETIWKLAVARDVMNSKVVCVTPEDDLNTAMRCFTAIAIDELPVVDAQDRGKLLGTLRHKNTIAAYNQRLMEYKRAGEEG
jgi:CIC family chloride channel protein